MIIGIPDDIELWETVAAIQVMQSLGIGGYFPRFDTVDSEAVRLMMSAGVFAGGDASDTVPLQTAAAYRAVNTSTESYQAVLARTSGLEQHIIQAPQFPNEAIEASQEGGIVICPFEVNDVFKLPWRVWQAIVRHIRTYGPETYLMARTGQRMDYATFSEGMILSRQLLPEKMKALAAARLVIGLPNEWTWMATAWKKKVLVLYPDDIPVDRWFGFGVAPYTLGRLLYTRSQIQVPVILAGLRRAIDLI